MTTEKTDKKIAVSGITIILPDWLAYELETEPLKVTELADLFRKYAKDKTLANYISKDEVAKILNHHYTDTREIFKELGL